MGERHLQGLVRRVVWAGAVVVLAGLAAPWAVAAEAGNSPQPDASLQWLPDDVAFYNAMLRNGEQIQAIRNSRAWKSIRQMPAVEAGLKEFRARIAEDPKAAQAQAVLENPETLTALATLGEMFAQEVFFAGDRGTIDVLNLFQQINAVNRFGSLSAQLSGQRGSERMKTQGGMLLSVLAENTSLMKTPGLLVGFRVKDKERIKGQLAKLEGIYNVMAFAAPPLAGRLKRTKIDGFEHLVLSLDAKMIPWEKVPMENLEQVELEKGDAEKVIAAAKKLTLVITLGVREDYLLLSIGPSTEQLARLGKGKALITRPEFDQLRKAADKRLVGISYLSHDMANQLMANVKDIDDLLEFMDEILEEVDLSDAQEAQIRKDAKVLAADLKRLLPEPGAIMGFSYLTDRGMEGYQYAWGKYPGWGQPRPLGLLAHLGGSPLVALVGRGEMTLADYDMLVRWAKTGHRYFEEYGLPEMDEDDQAKYKQVLKAYRPLLARLNQVNRELCIPALADGQMGLVVDARLKTRQIAREAPQWPNAMPLPEPALCFGVSDAERLRKALREYREIVNAGLAAAREIEPNDVPEFQIPLPQQTSTDEGTLYWYAPPAEAGLDPQVKLVLGLSDKVAALTSNEAHARRLLQSKPLTAGGVLKDAQRPRATAFVFDWAGLIDAATPWIELAAREVGKQQGVDVTAPLKLPAAKQPRQEKDAAKPAKPPKAAKKAEGKAVRTDKQPSILDQVRTVLKALKTLQSVTLESYQEKDTWVTHSLVEIRDIP